MGLPPVGLDPHPGGPPRLGWATCQDMSGSQALITYLGGLFPFLKAAWNLQACPNLDQLPYSTDVQSDPQRS